MKKFIILIPLFNDWKSASRLLSEIDSETINWNVEVSVIIINDASTEMKSGLDSNYKKIKQVKILNMKNNIVHQRCIATGLKYICENENFDRVIVMDADGEDRPVELNDFFQKEIKTRKWEKMKTHIDFVTFFAYGQFRQIFVFFIAFFSDVEK